MEFGKKNFREIDFNLISRVFWPGLFLIFWPTVQHFQLFFSDLSSGVFLPQPENACQVLCKTRKSNSSLCCDPIADCSCGTHTGHYACICPQGHYGQGLVGQCTGK